MNTSPYAAISFACFVLTACASTPEPEQWTYDPQLLSVKTMFAENEQAALATPYVGIATSEGVQSGLFPIRATGVSTEPIRLAAERFLATLTPVQATRTVHAVDDPEWRRWSNVDNAIYVRRGVSLKEMSGSQRDAAMTLMRTSLSAKGFALTEAIRKTDQTLREINDDILSFDEDQYFFTVMGLPSETEPWGWQIDGHHLVINYFVLGDQVVMTPAFFGAEPAIARSGKYLGNAVLQDEQNLGLKFMQSLDPSLQAKATLDSRKAGQSIQAQANKDNLVLDYAGAPVSEFSAEQKTALLRLIDQFVGNMADGHAAIRMGEVAAHLDNTWFAWVGPVDDDAVFYYRIHSPVILIEFDHQNPVGTTSINQPGTPTRDHIHTIIRTPNGNDYGKDLLGQHLADHDH